MRNPLHTIRRNNGIVYRRRYPSDLKNAATGEFFQVSLKTGDARIAIRRINDWNLPKQFQDKVDELRHRKLISEGLNLDQSRSATEAEALEAIRCAFMPSLKSAEVHLTHSVIPGAVPVDHPLVVNDLKQYFGIESEVAKSYLNQLSDDPNTLRAAVSQYDGFIDDITRPDPLNPSDKDVSLACRILAEAGFTACSGSTALRAAANAVGRGRFQYMRLYKARLLSDYDMRISDPLFADYMTSNTAKEESKPPSTVENGKPLRFNQLVAEYRAKKAPKWPQGTADDFDYTMKLAAQFFGSQCLLESISAKDCLSLRDTLTDLPANHNKKTEFKGLDIRAAVALAQKKGLPGRAPQTLKKQLGEVCRLFKYAERFQYVPVSPARGLAEDIVDDVDPRDKRSALLDKDIETILNSVAIASITAQVLPINWSKISPKDANIFWLLMILITTGMRLSEACQLFVSDIKTDKNGMAYFSLQPEKPAKETGANKANQALNEEELKRFKTFASRRELPVPQELLDLGLLDWQKIQQTRESKLLLGHFKRNGKGKYSSASIFIARYFASLNLSVPNATAHHLRHTMKERLENGGVDFKTICDFGGWSINSNVANRYGNRSSAEKVAKNLADGPAMPSVFAVKSQTVTPQQNSSSG
jgi:integrase